MRRLVVLVSLSGLAIRLGGLIDRGGVGVGIRNGHAGRAQDAIAAQDLNAALDHLNAAIDHDPGFAEAWNVRGSVFYLLNEYALALNDIEHVLALEPRHFGAMEGLAIIFVETEHPDLALRVVERARAVNPNRESLKETEARLERDLGASDL